MSEPTGLLPFITARFSPMRFDKGHQMTDAEVDLLLEAARRAPSAGNSQPWAFIVAHRGDPVHARLLPHLARSSSGWAPEASLLLVNLAQRFVEGSRLEYSEFAHYDLGQAVAHLSVQAHALGLQVHQFRAFDRVGVADEFEVPPHWEATSIAAIGVPVGTAMEHAGAGTSRERRTLRHITWERSAGADPVGLVAGRERLVHAEANHD